jgi:cytochrome c oxidase subunit 2
MSSFWFTPTRLGRYESMCAQLCGVGHPNMRGFVVVESEADFQAWFKQQPTFEMTQAQAGDGAGADSLSARGKKLAQSKGCVACHTYDGGPGVGPTWKDLFGKTETMQDGSTALVDDAYLREFIRNPMARAIKGFAQVMPKIDLTDEELSALTAYIKADAAKP